MNFTHVPSNRRRRAENPQTRTQRLANRLNAQKSTGPKTTEGKAKFSLNACRYQLVFLEGYMAEWKPQGAHRDPVTNPDRTR
jgi:hypothetical protein